MNKDRYQAVTRVKLLSAKAMEATTVLDNYRNAVIDFLQSDNAEVTRLTAELADRTHSEQDYRDQLASLSKENDKLREEWASVTEERLSLVGKVFALQEDLMSIKICFWLTAVSVSIFSLIGLIL